MKNFYIETININCDVHSTVSVDLTFQLEGDSLDRRLTIMEDGTIVNGCGPGGPDEQLIGEMTSGELREVAECIDLTLARLKPIYEMAAILNSAIIEKKGIPPILGKSTPAEAAERG